MITKRERDLNRRSRMIRAAEAEQERQTQMAKLIEWAKEIRENGNAEPS